MLQVFLGRKKDILKEFSKVFYFEWLEFGSDSRTKLHLNRRARIEYLLLLIDFFCVEDIDQDVIKKLDLDVDKAIIVTAFLKREAGKERLLFQVGEEYNALATLCLLPYLKSWYIEPGIAVGHAGTAEFEDLADMLSDFRRYPSSACVDHKGYNENHTAKSNVAFWHALADVERVRAGGYKCWFSERRRLKTCGSWFSVKRHSWH